MNLPNPLTPHAINKLFFDQLGACGCSCLYSMIEEVKRLLVWAHLEIDSRPAYDTLYPSKGIFYLIAGLLDHNGLIEHGTSIRCSWLTDDGIRLLRALETMTPSEIELAEASPE